MDNQAFDAGWQAAEDGEMRCSNPLQGDAAFWWNEGWIAGSEAATVRL